MRRGDAEREPASKARMPVVYGGAGGDDGRLCLALAAEKAGMRQTVRKNPAECTGCGACVSICPKQAIAMQPDAEGFLYPKVDGEKCVFLRSVRKAVSGRAGDAGRHAHLLGAQAKDEALRGAVILAGGVFTLLGARG
ncbi:MAG: 4Fe-4S dicluster domain-containing protein [Christensenellales bacterium]